jgi:hypothetical protein
VRVFLFFVFCIIVFASNAIEDMRKIAQQRYQQSDHYKILQQNMAIAEENTLRQDLIIQEQINLAQLMKKQRERKVVLDFINAESNERKLTLLNIMKGSWKETEVPLFEDWLVESSDVESPASLKLMLKVNTYKSLERQLDFYHYICTTMLFSKADPLLDMWDIDMTVLELVFSQFDHFSPLASFDKGMAIFRHYLSNDEKLIKQLAFWQHYREHYALELPLIEFFHHLDQTPIQYNQFLYDVIDREFARSFEGLP